MPRAKVGRPTGRPTLFTDGPKADFVRAVSLGAPRALAAQAAGWSKQVWWDYAANGELARRRIDAGENVSARDRAFAEFLSEVEKAESACCQGALACVVTAAQRGTWQAGAWLAERRWPEHFSRRTEVELTGADGAPVEVNVSAKELLELVAKVTGMTGPATSPIIDVEPNGQKALGNGKGPG